MVQKYGMQPPSNLGRLKFLGKDQVGRPSNVGVERVGGEIGDCEKISKFKVHTALKMFKIYIY